MRRLTGVLLIAATGTVACVPREERTLTQTLVQEVRQSIAAGDFAAADARLATSLAEGGPTPEWLEAKSWTARGHLAAGRLDEAERAARDTYRRGVEMLETRSMDQEPKLPLAYGAAVEVLGQVEARRGARTDAVLFLEREREAHAGTSVQTRIQKNINLLSLEGTRAPEIAATEYLGPAPPSLEDLEGKVVLLFFWAHWCADCKTMAPVLARLDEQYRAQGLVIFAPTQRYGYVRGGREATPEAEKQYIDEVRQQVYRVIADDPVPLDEANHRRYGVSSTPTVVLVDRAGIIRLYHPGRMTWEDLEPRVRQLM